MTESNKLLGFYAEWNFNRVDLKHAATDILPHVDTSMTSSMLISPASNKVRGAVISRNADDAGTTQSLSEYVRASRSVLCGVRGSIELNAVGREIQAS